MYTYIVYYYSLIFQNKKGDLQKVSHQFGADDRGRTSTGISSHGILSPLCFGGLKK